MNVKSFPRGVLPADALTLDQAALVLGISGNTLKDRAWRRARGIPTHRFLRWTYWRRNELEKWLTKATFGS